MLLGFLAAEGLGETFYFPASMSLVSDYHTSRTRSRAMGFHQTSVYIGTIAGGFFAGLIGQHYGWRWSFIVFGAMGLILGIFLAKFLVEPKRGAADERPAAEAEKPARKLSTGELLRLLGRTPTALLLMLAFACANYVAMVLLSWMPKFLYTKFHMNLAMSGLTATLFVQLASMAGAPLGGYLADWLRRRTVTGRILVQAGCVLCGAPFVFLCGNTQTVGVLIFALACWGLFKGIYDANIFASVYDVIPSEARGTVAGLMNMFGWLGGGSLAPTMIGILATNYGLSFAISSTFMVYVAAGTILLCAVAFTVRRDVAKM